ncbi:MAG: methylated-DNA--[protein]-cysteine S-methyltransferase [Burkholderiaceae bacterium]
MKNAHATALFSAIVEAPFGAIGIRTAASCLQELVYLPSSFGAKSADAADVLAAEAAAQVTRYLEDPDTIFDLPLPELGTPFQRKVWQAIAAIPRGKVLTYGQIAKQIHSAPRAVGQACGANWFPLVIPCHRVTAANGLGGFAHHDDASGFHLSVKRWLLTHEGATGIL